MKQKGVFLGGEGDEWFRRNEAGLARLEPHLVRDLAPLEPYVRPGLTILEVGCSSGAKLSALEERFPAHSLRLCGIDPSSAAIESGRQRHPSLDLHLGTADSLPFADASIDILMLGSCLYLVDRGLLFATVAEVDRVLREGGILSITDFDTPRPMKRPYHHHQGVYSYKNDYAAFFLGGSHYSLAFKQHYSSGENLILPRPDDRISTTLLYKEYLSDVYPDADG